MIALMFAPSHLNGLSSSCEILQDLFYTQRTFGEAGEQLKFNFEPSKPKPKAGSGYEVEVKVQILVRAVAVGGSIDTKEVL